MSIGNSRVTIGAIRPRFNRVVAWTLCILGFVPLSGQADHTGRASSNVRPARADQVEPSPRSNSPKPQRQAAVNLQDNDSARVARLSEIARALDDPRSDAVALTTEAARLCGFSIWREDRSKIADPAGAPALKLAVTDTEIREYTEMFRAGHSVALGNLIGAMDVLFKGIGGQGSVGPHLMKWLQSGVLSENASVRALTGFLQDLGTFRPGATFGNFAADAERLDPIQALFILRVLTEDMGVPLRRALAIMKPPSSLAEPCASVPAQRLQPDAPAWAEAASAGGPLVSFDPPPQAAESPGWAEDASTGGLPASIDPTLCSEAPGWAEDAFAGGITGLYGEVSTIMGLEEKAFGKWAEGAGKANAILSIVKFIATYTFLEGEIRVEAPGQPLVRTKNHDPGDNRTVVARFFINGTRVTDWMKDNRCLVVLAGIDQDMPKTGALKGVRTEWQFAQSQFPRLQLVRTVAGSLTGNLSNVRTDDNGEASVQLEGAPQETNLDPSKVMPIEKVVKITVTPQVKATEMKQDLVDAVLGAIGIKDGPAGFITPLMETLYRMNWTGETSLNLRVRDWQLAETIGQLHIEIKGIGREFRKEYALQMTIDRSLAFENVEMNVVGGEMPAAPDPEFLKKVPPVVRAQIEEGMKQMAEMAKKRHFVGTGPGIARMSINDQKSLLTKNDTDEQSDLETWTGSQEVGFSPRQPTGMEFSVEIDLEKKTAAVGFFVTIKAKNVNDSRTEYPAAQHRDVEPIKSHSTRDPGMEIFDDLTLRAPFGGSKTIVIPLKEEPIIDGGGAMNYYGSVPIPFTFGPNGQFKGTAFLSYSVTRKVVKPK